MRTYTRTRSPWLVAALTLTLALAGLLLLYVTADPHRQAREAIAVRYERCLYLVAAQPVDGPSAERLVALCKAQRDAALAGLDRP